MYRSVADHNDEQVIAMFMSNHKGEKKERTVRNSDAHLIYVRCRE